MRSRRQAGWAYRTLAVLIWTGRLVAIYLAAVIKATPPTSAPAFLQDLLEWSASVAWWVLPGVIVVTEGMALAKGATQSPREWEAIHVALDEFKRSVFGDDGTHNDRVTLFKHHGWRLFPLRGGCLVAVERSGHLYRKSSVVFRAGDDPDQAEGVAGRTWGRDGIVSVANLPDPGAWSPEAKSEYAKETWVTERWLDEEKPLSRSLCGIPLEVRGQPWGVIVLDSRAPDDIAARARGPREMVVRIVAKLL